MRQIQFGLVIPAEFPDAYGPASLVRDAHHALELVAGHFDSVWVVDHLQSGDDQQLEGFTTLTYLAARHPGFRFGNAVLCQSFRNRALLAKMGAALQLLSGGRFILGSGSRVQRGGVSGIRLRLRSSPGQSPAARGNDSDHQGTLVYAECDVRRRVLPNTRRLLRAASGPRPTADAWRLQTENVTAPLRMLNQTSTWFSQLACVGVKWKWTFGWRLSQASCFGLWVLRLSSTTCSSCPG